MSEACPFPVPEATRKAVSADVAKAFPPWHGLDILELRPTDPAIVQYVYHWHHETVGLIKCIEELVLNLDGAQYESEYQKWQWRTLSAQVSAADLRFKQLDALLQWASLTWKHDPNICRAFGKGPEDSPPREGSDPEQAAVADTSVIQ